MPTWPIHEAQARWSELLKSAQSQPQDITVHGKPVAVLLSRETFDRLSRAQPQETLVDFMQRSPLFGTNDVDLERDRPV